MPRQVSNRDVLFDWLAHTEEPERREAMLTWLQAACIDPLAVSHGFFQRTPTSRRKVHFAHVEPARATVTFIIGDVPALVLHLLSIDDDD